MADIDIPSGTAKDNARAKQPVVAYACLYQRLALVAREHGYALAMHGSLAADLDLVAVPWTHEAVSGEALAEALATAIPGHLHLDTYARPRPGGVRKHVIHLGGGPYLDLAVTPLAALSPPPPAAPAEMPATCRECGCTTGGGDYCYEHKPYMVEPLKDGSYRVYRNGVYRVWRDELPPRQRPGAPTP